MRRVMKNTRKVIMAVTILTMMITGCGSKEVVMKEYVSKDQSVRIQMNEEWKEQHDLVEEDMSGLADGWIAASSQDDSEAILVAQMAKHIYNISDMDDFRELVISSWSMSEVQPVENPSVSGMDVAETDSCTMTVEGLSGDGLVLYGETEYAYYGILYAAPKINAAKTEYFNNVCASFQETAPEITDTMSAESTDTIQWFNNTYAILTAVNGWDYTMYGGMPADESSAVVAQSLLSSSWDVTDRESADETIDWILEEGHRTSLTEEMDYLAEMGLGDIPEDERADAILENFELSEEEAERYAYLFALYEQYDLDAAAGWDYSRAMSLLAYYYLAGFYTEEEALDMSLEVAETIQSTFDSWDSYMESYFAGYEYWAEESSQERREIYEEIKAAADNPFDLEWGMTLEKSW